MVSGPLTADPPLASVVNGRHAGTCLLYTSVKCRSGDLFPTIDCALQNTDRWALGAEFLQVVTLVPTWFLTRARHPDGLVVEYVRHTEAADRCRVTDL